MQDPIWNTTDAQLDLAVRTCVSIIIKRLFCPVEVGRHPGCEYRSVLTVFIGPIRRDIRFSYRLQIAEVTRFLAISAELDLRRLRTPADCRNRPPFRRQRGCRDSSVLSTGSEAGNDGPWSQIRCQDRDGTRGPARNSLPEVLEVFPSVSRSPTRQARRSDRRYWPAPGDFRHRDDVCVGGVGVVAEWLVPCRAVPYCSLPVSAPHHHHPPQPIDQNHYTTNPTPVQTKLHKWGSHTHTAARASRTPIPACSCRSPPPQPQPLLPLLPPSGP